MTSTIKVDNIQDQDGNNIINENSNTITIGASGDTVTLASGASQSGFGRTGTVDWQTGSIKTATFTAANGEGYFANTSGGAFTMNLPAGTAGNIVSVVDYTNTFQTNNLTVAPNGSQKLGGVAATVALSTEGQSVTFVYVDDTEGWKNVQDATSNVTGISFVAATGGTITTSGNCKIHTFTGPGTFCVSQIATCSANNQVSYMVVAGGGGGASTDYTGGGGGAGGFREDKSPVTPYTSSPLEGAGPITVTATAFPITVGGGGSVGGNTNGSNSIFSTITSAGGGFGAGSSPTNGGPGGSGGGARSIMCGGASSGGTGNTPPTSPAQGSSGGNGPGNGRYVGGGGGGGATATGTAGSTPTAGPGGAGATTSISATPTAYAGGGGGGSNAGIDGGTQTTGGNGGAGGGGRGGARGSGCGSPNPASRTSTAGTANTGGGGGGRGGDSNTGSAGGSGIVIIRYKFQ